MSEVLMAPVFKPDISFSVSEDCIEEKCTILHITCFQFSFLRIWESTFLIQEEGIRKKLLQAYNISRYPEWRMVNAGHRFTLIFEGLDKECKRFNLFEDIPESGGFFIPRIQRNKTDVYNVEL